MLRETTKIEKTSRRGNARVCLLGTACWELPLLIFPGVSLLPAAGDAREPLRGLPPSGSSANSRDFSFGGAASAQSGACPALRAFLRSFDNRHRGLGTRGELFLHCPSLFSSAEARGTHHLAEIETGFPKLPLEKKHTSRQRRVNS